MYKFHHQFQRVQNFIKFPQKEKRHLQLRLLRPSAPSYKRPYSPSPLRALVSSEYSNKHHHHFVKRSRFLAAVKTHLGIYFGQAVAMRIMIKATGCPAPMLDRGTGFLFEEPNPEREP